MDMVAIASGNDIFNSYGDLTTIFYGDLMVNNGE